MRRHKNGFTLIEIMLVLAISGLLFLIGFIGIGTRTRNVQTTDSVRALQSRVEREFNQVRSGVNTEIGAGTTADQILLGKLLQFNANSSEVTVYTVVGDRLFGNELRLNAGEQDIDLIGRANPVVLPDTETYQMQWGTEYLRGRNPGFGPSGVNWDTFGFLRSPGSSQIYPIAIPDYIDVTAPSVPIFERGTFDSVMGSEVELRICVVPPNGQNAALYIGSERQNESVLVEYDNPPGCT